MINEAIYSRDSPVHTFQCYEKQFPQVKKIGEENNPDRQTWIVKGMLEEGFYCATRKKMSRLQAESAYEILVAKRMKHANIISTLHHFGSESEQIIVQELGEFGSLQGQIAHKIKNEKVFSDLWVTNALV